MEKKVMSDYALLCTEEQTRKALELGAPIYHMINNMTIYGEGWFQYNGLSYCCPSAEQMLGWLEEQGIIIIFMATAKDDGSGYTWIAHVCHFQDESVWISDKNLSRKEATIAAISAALDYLLNTK